ncbi:hypothetical protein CEXT_619471 [Caerostris extrusa]|uniref:Uncharacterized protein n=1 Tax=Caerostris extrusa TaxID=172846 RepID=A0AAV4SS94_CAEEX|nr:hypothetical protein CEXT_619471 [Caerostris extrusa]
MVNHQSHRSRQANSNGSAHITLMANEEESQLSLFWVVNRTTKHATSSSYTITTAENDLRSNKLTQGVMKIKRCDCKELCRFSELGEATKTIQNGNT